MLKKGTIVVRLVDNSINAAIDTGRVGSIFSTSHDNEGGRAQYNSYSSIPKGGFRLATEDEIEFFKNGGINIHGMPKVFPEKWVVEGEYDLAEEYKCPSEDKNHWFNKVCGIKRDISFLNDYYYNINDFWSSLPAGYTLVTKEQLLNHYKINENG